MSPDLLLTLVRWMPVPFVFAFGACVGSLLNVLAYRMPKGISVVWPPSACPACGTKLNPNDNIPILGWFLLRGRCRYCRSAISPEYPIVETVVALLFTLPVVLWYVIPNPWGRTMWIGFDWAILRPEWVLNGPWTWAYMAMILALLGLLAAMTLIDAKTYTIPLVLPWLATAVGVAGHVGLALWVQQQASGPGRAWMADPVGILRYVPPGYVWVIPTPGWHWTGAAVGGIVGLGVSLLLLRFGLIGRSFADYDEWEQQALAQAKLETGGAPEPSEPGGGAAGPTPTEAASEAEKPQGSEAAELWIAYPHARREMVRELAFVAPMAVLAYAGFMLAMRWWPTPALPEGTIGITFESGPPLWLAALGGSLLGYLVGGGIVWAIRIFGSLAFGKEAMGMGDVHLLAAVGACLGWIDSVLAFFLAAFVGVAWAIVGAVLGGKTARTMQYGPSLSIAVLLVLVGKPAIEWGLTLLFGTGPGVPPINIP